MTSTLPDLPANEFLLYAAPDGAVKVRVLFKDETVWLAQKGLAELFGVGVPAINKHLKNIFESGELEPTATISKMEIVQLEGTREITRPVDVYNLDAIIAVGYRVNSYQATQFRIWATKVLREFMIKGFVLDDERLKQGAKVFGKDYFDDLLERIREIVSKPSTSRRRLDRASGARSADFAGRGGRDSGHGGGRRARIPRPLPAGALARGAVPVAVASDYVELTVILRVGPPWVRT
jgi:hypothetical protein